MQNLNLAVLYLMKGFCDCILSYHHEIKILSTSIYIFSSFQFLLTSPLITSTVPYSHSDIQSTAFINICL